MKRERVKLWFKTVSKNADGNLIAGNDWFFQWVKITAIYTDYHQRKPGREKDFSLSIPAGGYSSLLINYLTEKLPNSVITMVTAVGVKIPVCSYSVIPPPNWNNWNGITGRIFFPARQNTE